MSSALDGIHHGRPLKLEEGTLGGYGKPRQLYELSSGEKDRRREITRGQVLWILELKVIPYHGL